MSKSKIIVPVNSGEKLKFPLQKTVLLFMSSGKIYSCRIKFAGKDFIKVSNVQERKVDKNGKVNYIDLQLQEDTIFSRNKIEGYNPNTKEEKSKNDIKIVRMKDRKDQR